MYDLFYLYFLEWGLRILKSWVGITLKVWHEMVLDPDVDVSQLQSFCHNDSSIWEETAERRSQPLKWGRKIKMLLTVTNLQLSRTLKNDSLSNFGQFVFSIWLFWQHLSLRLSSTMISPAVLHSLCAEEFLMLFSSGINFQLFLRFLEFSVFAMLSQLLETVYQNGNSVFKINLLAKRFALHSQLRNW